MHRPPWFLDKVFSTMYWKWRSQPPERPSRTPRCLYTLTMGTSRPPTQNRWALSLSDRRPLPQIMMAVLLVPTLSLIRTFRAQLLTMLRARRSCRQVVDKCEEGDKDHVAFLVIYVYAASCLLQLVVEFNQDDGEEAHGESPTLRHTAFYSPFSKDRGADLKTASEVA